MMLKILALKNRIEKTFGLNAGRAKSRIILLLSFSVLLLSSIVGHAQTTLYSTDFGDGSSLPAGWSVTAGTSPGFASSSVFTSSGYTDPNASGGGNLLADDNFSVPPFELQEIVYSNSLSTVGFSNIQVKWGGMASSGAAFPGLTFEYSIDGGGVWNPVAFNDDPLLASDDTWYTITEITLPGDAEGVADLQFRFSYTSLTSGDVYAMDDFRVNGQGVNFYYSASSGNLDLLTSWGTNTDGTGTNPTDFTTDGKTYNIRNNAAPTIGAAWTVSGAGSKIVVQSTTPSNFTIPSGFAFTGTVDVESGATLTINNTSIPTMGILGATSTVVYGAASVQTVTTATYGNLTISSGGTITHVLGGNVTVDGALDIVGTTKLGIGANTLTLNGTITGTGTITGSSSSNMSIGGTGALGTMAFTAGAANRTLNNFTINRTSSGTVTLGAGSIAIIGALSLNEGILNANGGLNLSNTVSQTNGAISFTAGTPLVGYTQSSDGQFVAWGNYGGLFFSSFGKTLASTGTITISGTFTRGTGAVTSTGSTIDFNGTGSQTVPVMSYNNLTISNARTGASNVTLVNGATIGVAGVFNPIATFGTGNYIVTNNTVDFNGTAAQTIPAFNYNNLTVSNTSAIVLAAAGTIGIGTTTGTFTPGTAAYTITGSTIDFRGTGAQTIPAFNYNNLTISNARTTNSVTLPNGGTVGVAGTFNPSATFTTGTYIVTNNTIDFNGTGTQGIPAFNYNNLTSSSTGDRTLAATGTIGVAEIFTPGTNLYTVTGSTVDFNGTIAQGIPAFDYNNLTSSSTGSRTLAAAGVVGIAGAFTPGTNVFTVTGSRVNFNGTSAQTIPAFSFNNLAQNNAAGVSLTGNVDLAGVMTINAGIFTTTGFNFTLLSTPSRTASIGPIPGGSDIAGNITMQRYTTGPSEWRFLTSAVSGATIADWTDDFATSGFTGTTCGPTDCALPGCVATCTFVSVYSYDESVAGISDNGFVEATDITNTIDINKGLWVYLGPNPLTFDVTGPPHTFVQAPAITYNVSAAGDDHDGWNQIANPYPSAIDWSDGNWTRANVEDVIYIYKSDGTYASYSTSGGALNGGSQYIASQQSFWVKANNAAPVVSMVEGVKAAVQDPAFLRTEKYPNTSYSPIAFKDFPVPLNVNDTPNSILFTASGNGYTDEMKIIFKQGATNNFDSPGDAWKLKNALYVHNFSSVITGNKDVAINAQPALTSDLHIPIRLTIPAGSGVQTYSIRRDSVLMLPMSSCIILEDTKTASMIDLRSTITYTFTISDTTVAPRFILHTYAPITKKAINATCSSSNNGKAIAKGTGTGPWDYVWKNSAGTILKTTLASAVADTLFNCASDTYSVSVTSAVCGMVSDTIEVKASSTLVGANTTQTNVNCFGGSNGSAAVYPSGGSPSYTYLWDNGQTTSAAVNLASGNYSVVVTDAGGCSATASVTISQPATQVANSPAQGNVSCFGGNDGFASCSPSGGTSPYSYLWSDGQTTSAAVNLVVGNYSATITDAAGCTLNTAVAISQPTQVSGTASGTTVSCFGQSDASASILPSGGTPSYSYLWSNGQTSASAVNLAAGNYSATVTDSKGCTATATVAISQPTQLSSVVSNVNASCFGFSDGSATVTASGGTSSYTFLWSNGQSAATAVNLPNGNYSVTVTDAEGCTSTATVAITQPAALTAGFSVSSDTVDIALGSNVTFTNGSSGAASYEWDFGDASAIDVSIDPAHTYSATGNYTVTLISSDGPCSDTAYSTIVVVNSNPTALNESNYESNINVGYENGEVYLLFSFASATKVNISVYNVLGEEMFSKNNLLVKDENIKLDFPPASVGMYIAVSEMTDAMVSKKIFIPIR